MSEPLVRVYSEQTKKVKYVTPAQVIVLEPVKVEVPKEAKKEPQTVKPKTTKKNAA